MLKWELDSEDGLCKHPLYTTVFIVAADYLINCQIFIVQSLSYHISLSFTLHSFLLMLYHYIYRTTSTMSFTKIPKSINI